VRGGPQPPRTNPPGHSARPAATGCGTDQAAAPQAQLLRDAAVPEEPHLSLQIVGGPDAGTADLRASCESFAAWAERFAGEPYRSEMLPNVGLAGVVDQVPATFNAQHQKLNTQHSTPVTNPRH